MLPTYQKRSDKIGLDDYLIKHSKTAFLKLRTEEYAESAELWKFNEDICYIRKLKAFYSFSLNLLFKSKAELLTAYERLSYQVPKANGEGFKTLYVAAEWCKWPHRQEYEDLVYAPGETNIVDSCLVNLWKGWGVEPKKGDVRPFYELVNFIFADDPDLKAWFLCWLAYPLQYPGTKLMQTVLLHSRPQGVGKTMLGEIIGDIYGDNFNTVSQDELHRDFNEWIARKQFILGEELSGTGSRDADRLKNMFTREIYNVNAKYQPNYILKDCVNYVLTSNHVDALFIEEYDRRCVVHEIRAKAQPLSFYKRISAWRRNGGASHLFYHLLNDVDTSKFESKGRAPETEAKQQMIDATKTDQDIFVSQMLDNPDEVLRIGRVIAQKDLFTLSEIVRYFDEQSSRRISARLVSKALRSAGIQGHQIATIDGTKKLWPCRNTDAWYRRDWGEWKAHYKNHTRSIKYK